MAVTTRAAAGADIPHLLALMREFYGEANYALDDAWATAAFAALLRDGRDGSA